LMLLSTMSSGNTMIGGKPNPDEPADISTDYGITVGSYVVIQLFRLNWCVTPLANAPYRLFGF